jgi:hypothetical protein
MSSFALKHPAVFRPLTLPDKSHARSHLSERANIVRAMQTLRNGADREGQMTQLKIESIRIALNQSNGDCGYLIFRAPSAFHSTSS